MKKYVCAALLLASSPVGAKEVDGWTIEEIEPDICVMSSIYQFEHFAPVRLSAALGASGDVRIGFDNKEWTLENGRKYTVTYGAGEVGGWRTEGVGFAGEGTNGFVVSVPEDFPERMVKAGSRGVWFILELGGDKRIVETLELTTSAKAAAELRACAAKKKAG